MAQDLVNKHIEDAIPEPFPGRRKPKGTRAAPGQLESDWRCLGMAGVCWAWLGMAGVGWTCLVLLGLGWGC